MKTFPEGYPPMHYCRACGRDFAALDYFDRHRIGTHEYLYAEGLAMTPPREDGRRCMTPEAMVAVGLHRLTDPEMQASARHRRRLGFEVEMWVDPAKAESIAGAGARRRERQRA